jgi:hypothetical protein
MEVADRLYHKPFSRNGIAPLAAPSHNRSRNQRIAERNWPRVGNISAMRGNKVPPAEAYPYLWYEKATSEKTKPSCPKPYGRAPSFNALVRPVASYPSVDLGVCAGCHDGGGTSQRPMRRARFQRSTSARGITTNSRP